jgi:dTDP-4-dehydrorhamnose 3,5-epimerase
VIFHRTELEDAWIIELEPRGDARGTFARTFCRDEFETHGLIADYVQQNMSTSTKKGTLRGLHFQRPPYTEAKLVRCVRGGIMDVIVDLRHESPTYLRHQQFELTANNRLQLYVPPGFGHGFQTLVDDIEVSYLVSARYTPASEAGVRWNDAAIGIDWPLPLTEISEKDASWPLLDPSAKPYF